MYARKMAAVAGVLLLLVLGNANANSYQEAVASWKTPEDVGNWLKRNFSFDTSRQHQIVSRVKKDGQLGLRARDPEKLYQSREGYCVDAAYFSLDALNKIDPSYNARWVFVWNDEGSPHHWVTAFDYEDKLYIMDYGTGHNWEPMQGVHGPYDSLDDYYAFLEKLNVPNFTVGDVEYRDMPGEID